MVESGSFRPFDYAMNTLTYILVVVGCALVAFWLVVAIGFAIGQFWRRRSSMNANTERAARMLGESFTPVGRIRWAWIAIQAIPLILIAAVVISADFFIRLTVGGWCWVTGRPMPRPTRLEDINNDSG